MPQIHTHTHTQLGRRAGRQVDRLKQTCKTMAKGSMTFSGHRKQCSLSETSPLPPSLCHYLDQHLCYPTVVHTEQSKKIHVYDMYSVKVLQRQGV